MISNALPTTATSPSAKSIVPSAAAAVPPHLAYLDGIRGLAASYVMLHHAWKIWFGPYTQAGVSGFFTNWLVQGGHLAVSIFIVLSGFCLMLPVVQTGQIRGGIISFYQRRARRILPPFYAALLVSLLLMGIDVVVFDTTKRNLFSFQNFAVNFLLLQDVLPRANAFNLPFWSVAVEWKIYFLFPFYVWACRKSVWVGGAFSVMLGVIVTLIFHRVRPDATLFQTCPWYLFSFGMGVCAAWLAKYHEKVYQNGAEKPAWAAFWFFAGVTWLVFLRMPLGVAGGNDNIRLAPLTDCLTAIASASGLLALYLTLLSQKKQTRQAFSLRILEAKPLVFVGMWAYSLYLLHYPLLDFWYNICTRSFTFLLPSAQVVVYFTGGVLLCLGTAYGFFLVVEKPLLKRKTVPAVSVETLPSPAGAAVS